MDDGIGAVVVPMCHGGLTMKTLLPGDMLYYPPHKAVGILVSRYVDPHGTTAWRYALRSPLANAPDGINLLNYFEAPEHKLLAGIRAGTLEHHESR